MILVTVGVHAMPFDRLLKAVDAVAVAGSLDRHELVVQYGASADLCKAGRRFAYCSGSELDGLLDHADLIITHGGIGTILPALRQRKHVIAIPRLSRYGEHHNDHQLEVCAELGQRRALFTSPDASDLPRLLALDPSQLVPFQAPCTIVDFTTNSNLPAVSTSTPRAHFGSWCMHGRNSRHQPCPRSPRLVSDG